MRVAKTNGGLKVHAVAGTYVVTLGFDLPQTDCQGLLGFSIQRTEHANQEVTFLTGMKCFVETDPGFPAGAEYSSETQPIQSFQWADYSAKPGQRYTYRVLARKGTPRALTTFAETSVTVTTEAPEAGVHDVYFNRGAAASQEYARRFGDFAPDKVGPIAVRDNVLENPAFVWLSRGLYEAMVALIESADPARDAFRVAAYEFSFEPYLTVLKAAIDKGVDIRIVYDGRGSDPRDVGPVNRGVVDGVGLEAACHQRTKPKSVISHNKFIVHIRDGQPTAVWTGGTNFSSGGIFGHSNVGHLVRDPVVAKAYLDYWTVLDRDPDDATLTAAVEALTPLPQGARPPAGITPIFSPRGSLDALNLYGRYAKGARDGLFMTFAFGINDVFKQVYDTSTAPLRFALLEQATRPMKDGTAKQAELAEVQRLRNKPENVFAIGNFIRTSKIDGWLKERLTGLNVNVRYIHNKFMLIDPLGNDPIVIAGSANFSAASTTDNDENMVIVRGDKRVADIYLGEYMRLWSHHAFRESLQWRSPNNPPKPLKTDDWWATAFGNTQQAARRKFFARV